MSPICEQATGMADTHFWHLLSARIAGQRVPFSGSLALTHRCNLGCIHCYAQENPVGAAGPAELGTGQWLKIIAEIKEAGCLFLLLTGGEPLLRDDFPEIYSFARKNGFLVTVFTNGTLVSERILNLFRELPPRLVEVSLYGASAATHDRITGVAGSFARTLQGIEALLAAGVQVRLKSVLMTLNDEDFPAIEELARNARPQVPFRSGDLSHPGRRPRAPRSAGSGGAGRGPGNGRCRTAGGNGGSSTIPFMSIPAADGLYNCGSGVNTFHVDPQGGLFPCLMVRGTAYALGAGNFRRWLGTGVQ